MYQFVVYNEYACELARSGWVDNKNDIVNSLYDFCRSEGIGLEPGDSISIVKDE